MKKTMMFCLALAASLWLPSASLANCGHCDKDKAAVKAHSCLCEIEGAEMTVTNTADGVTITVTAKDPAVVKKIQEAAAKKKEGGCAKCGKKAKCTGKPGCKCPHCAKKGEKK